MYAETPAACWPKSIPFRGDLASLGPTLAEASQICSMLGRIPQSSVEVASDFVEFGRIPAEVARKLGSLGSARHAKTLLVRLRGASARTSGPVERETNFVSAALVSQLSGKIIAPQPWGGAGRPIA